MSKFLDCLACKIAARGIKTRVAAEHTCGRFGKGYKEEPENKIIGVEEKKYFKVKIHQKIIQSTNTDSALFSIVRGQWLNGYKVPPATELWVSERFYFEDTGKPAGPGVDACIWVREDFYNKLVFIKP